MSSHSEDEATFLLKLSLKDECCSNCGLKPEVWFNNAAYCRACRWVAFTMYFIRNMTLRLLCVSN